MKQIKAKALIAALAVAFSTSALADIKVGVIGPFSGGSAPFGESMLAGIRVAAEEINAKGGILGEKVVLVERDDQAKNENGPLFTQELIEKEKVTAGLSFVNTGVAKPSLPIWQKAKVPLIIPASAGSPLTREFAQAPEGNYIFRVSAYDKLQSKMIVEEAVKRGYTKVALLTDTTAYGNFGHDDLVAALKEQQAKGVKIEVVADEKFAVGDKDMTAQVLRAKEANAEGILLYGIGPELAVIAKNRSKVSYKVPMIGAWGLGLTNFIDGAGKDGNNAVTPQSFIQSAALPGRQTEFVTKVLKSLGKDRIPCAPAAAQGYDALYILKAAVEQAKSKDGDKIKAALEDLRSPVEGVITTYTKPFDKDDHEALNQNNVRMGIVQDGKIIASGK